MKILLVTSRYPWPPRRGDQMRALQMLDFLSVEHELTLLTTDRDFVNAARHIPRRVWTAGPS